MSNKAPIKLVLGLISTLVLLSSLFWACIPRPEPEGQLPITFTVGKPVEVASETIGMSGGIISIDKPGDPLDGLTVEIPEGAYESPVTFTISENAISHVKAKDGAIMLSPLIQIDNGGEYSQELIEVKVPVTVPDGYFAMAFSYDQETGDFEGLPSFSEDEGSLTFATRHFSKKVIAAIPKSVLDTLDIPTDFKPDRDAWNLANMGSYLSPHGYCNGITLTALHYYRDRKMYHVDDERLWQDDYDNGLGPEMKTPGFWQDDKWAIQLCSAATSLKKTEKGLNRMLNYADVIERLFLDRGMNWTEQQFYSTAFGIWLQHEPQLITVRVSSNRSLAHSLICWGIYNNELHIADPNYPGNCELYIEYDRSSKSFKPYNSALGLPDIKKGKGINFDEVIYSGTTAFYDVDKLYELWMKYELQDFYDYFPKYGILVTEFDTGGNEQQSYELHPTSGLTTDAKFLKFSIYAPYQARATVYRFEDRGTPLSVDMVELSPGDNWLGIYVEGQKDGEWGWAGFDWVKINYDYEVEETPIPDDDYMCSMEDLRATCKRDKEWGLISHMRCPNGTCWECVDGEPVQVECLD